MMFVRGAAKVVNNAVDGGRQNRDATKQLRVKLDDSRLKCDKLERDVENARVSSYFFVDEISVIFIVVTVSVAQ